MRNYNKTTEILEHLKTNESITSYDAIIKYGCTRLSAVIFNLKKKGYLIDSELVTDKDKHGDVCRYAVYKLREE